MLHSIVIFPPDTIALSVLAAPMPSLALLILLFFLLHLHLLRLTLLPFRLVIPSPTPSGKYIPQSVPHQPSQHDDRATKHEQNPEDNNKFDNVFHHSPSHVYPSNRKAMTNKVA